MISSGISKENLIKLGLAGAISASNQNNFTDDEKIKHSNLSEYKLDIINKGTLRKPELDLIIKQKIDSQTDHSIYNYYSVPLNPEKKYSAECDVNCPLIGQLSYYSFDKKNYKPEDNDFFLKFQTQDKIVGTNITGTFSRFSFPSGYTNATTLSGLSYNAIKKTYRNLVNSEFTFSTPTKKLINNFSKLRTWRQSDTTGILSNNFQGHYIPYPNTIDISNYNAYNIPLKISTFLNNLNPFSQQINGLLMISTGNGTGSKICYISPHGLKSGYQNTYTFISGSSINVYNEKFESKRIGSGILVKALTLGSEYYTGNIFPKTGIRFSTEERTGDYLKASISGNPGFHINVYDIDTNEYLKQNTPIKDTLFYKFYSGLYTGSKVFNTGSWDGIIPSGRQITIEFITTELNKEIGMKNDLYLIYSGFGTNDSIDAKCSNYLSHFNSESGLLKNTKIKIDGSSLVVRGYGFGISEHDAYIKSKDNAKYNILNKLSKMIKTWTPEFIYQNRKFKKLQKFLNK